MDFESLHNVNGESSDNIIQRYTTISNVKVGDMCEFISGKVRKRISTSVESPSLISLSTVSSGSIGNFGVVGLFKGLSGLIPNKTYYSDVNGNLTLTVTAYKVGTSLSTTELLIKLPYWEKEI